MAKTYIMGHRKPDTDSVVAAMALEYLYQQKTCFGYHAPEAVIVDPLNPETEFLFKKFGVKAPRQITVAEIKPEDQVVLVDHNEADQRLEGLNPDQIVEIIDHHKANLNLNAPIFMTFKTWGSSCAIVYFMMQTMAQTKVEPTKPLASLMLAAILSDTVGFKSPTTTEKDKKFAQALAKLADIEDLDSFAYEIFQAKSDVAKLTDEQVVKNDYKIFKFVKKTMIAQLETVEQDALLAKRQDALLKAMAAVKKAEGVELFFVAVTDVLKVNTKLLIMGDAEAQVAEKAFGGRTVAGVLDIGAKLSRKKEIAPAIEKAI